MRLRLMPLMLLPLLAGCALGPTVPKPDVHTPAAFEAPTDITQPGAPLDQWWTAYNDPQLESLIEQALINAPDARSARARLQEAIATRAGALAGYGPQGALQVMIGGLALAPVPLPNLGNGTPDGGVE